MTNRNEMEEWVLIKISLAAFFPQNEREILIFIICEAESCPINFATWWIFPTETGIVSSFHSIIIFNHPGDLSPFQKSINSKAFPSETVVLQELWNIVTKY